MLIEEGEGGELAPAANLPWEKEPEKARARVVPWRARAVGMNRAKRAQRSSDRWSCSMLQRKAKKPRGPGPVCPGGKFLPDPNTGDRLFPEHLSKTWLLGPQAGHASQKTTE